MLKVRNLGNRFCSITAGIMEHGAVKKMEVWEIRILVKLPTYKLQIVME